MCTIGAVAGQHDYFMVDGVQCCVAQSWLVMFFLIPIVPLSAPRVMVNYKPCSCLWRRTVYAEFNETPPWALAKTLMYTYLGLLTLGLVCLMPLKASDERREVIIAACGLREELARLRGSDESPSGEVPGKACATPPLPTDDETPLLNKDTDPEQPAVPVGVN